MSFAQVNQWLREPVPSLGETPRSALLWAHFDPFGNGIGPDDEAGQSDLCGWLAEYPGFWDGLPAGLTPAGLVRAMAVAFDLYFWGFTTPDGGCEVDFGDWFQLALARPRRSCGGETTRRAVAVALAGTESGCVG